MSDRIVVTDENSIIRTTDANRIIIENEYNIIINDSAENLVIIENNDTSIIETSEQGPAGPPIGIGTETENLPFVGSGTGANKTITGIEGNLIFEEFGVGDEIFVIWRYAHGLDTSKSIRFSGGFFPVADGTNRTADWEVHITTVGNVGTTENTGFISTGEFPIPDIAFDISLGYVDIDHTTYDFANTQVIHIRLKRIASSNDSGVVAVAGLAISYTTDGRVGEQGDTGDTGATGPAGDEDVPYRKDVDFVTDDIAYIGEAAPGTLTSEAFWRIKKIVFVGDDSTTTWADGTAAEDKILDNKLSYTYL